MLSKGLSHELDNLKNPWILNVMKMCLIQRYSLLQLNAQISFPVCQRESIPLTIQQEANPSLILDYICLILNE